MDLELIELFNISYIPEPNSGCWIWTEKVLNRYGVIGFKKKIYKGHRLSFIIHKGEIPHKMNVCHKCDTPLCVNPDHLWVGTQKDNVHDMERKGRAVHPKGDRHRTRTCPEATPRGDNHFSRRHPEKVARGDKHGARLHPEKILRGSQIKLSKFTEDQIKSIRNNFVFNEKTFKQDIKKLAKEYNVWPSTIQRIVLRLNWKHVV